MNLDGSGLVRFTYLQNQIYQHAWRPDSKGLAFFGKDPDDKLDVFYQSLLDNEAVRISSDMQEIRYLGWLPFKTALFDSIDSVKR